MRRGVWHILSLVTLVSAAACATGCGGSQQKLSGTYAEDAERAFDDALKAYRKNDCNRAEPAFRDVRRRFPYSRYAPLAELRAADCLFKQKKYIEAIDGYKRFVEVRASHEKVPYARYQIARAYFEQIPGDWFVMPPAHERDQAATRQALRYLAEFLDAYPKHETADKARALFSKCQTYLARHELYAAGFYLKQNKPLAALMRIRTLAQDYPENLLKDDAVAIVERALRRTEGARAARLALDALAALDHEHPKVAVLRERAEERLRVLGAQ